MRSRGGFRVLQRLRRAAVCAAGGPGTGLGGPGACRRLSGSVIVFNREMKKRQKDWAASLQDGQQYDYLRDEVRRRGRGGGG